MIHFKKMDLPDDIEIVIVDDGSVPPLPSYDVRNLIIYPTNDFRPWTHTAAFNIGAKMAKGEYQLQLAIDHIVTKKLIDECLSKGFDFLRFKREVAVLTEEGNVTQDKDELIKYGFPEDRMERRGLRISAHSGIYFIKSSLYWKIGGRRVGNTYPHRDEVPVRRAIEKEWRNGLRKYGDEDRPTLYMIPNGRFCGEKNYNPFGLFHNLKRDESNPKTL